jgi:sigma-B regulation protein RsbU (phosphoserine phosphatase)
MMMPTPGGIVDPGALMRVLGVLEKLNASNDLREVLGLIVDSMRDCLRAERASVFQFDPASNELFMTQGHGGIEIRFPISKGIAGEAARTRSIINVKDAWEDSRFNPEFDKKTGFRTKGLLTIPLISSEGALQGVAQVLNKDPKLGVHFDQGDEVIAKALASQAAIALRRATLIEAEMRKKRLEGDLAVARKIQQSSWPKEIPRIEGYSIAAASLPAEETGGDTYDLIDLGTLAVQPGDEGHGREMQSGLVLLMGDATGHGIGPALSVAQARAMVRMGCRLGVGIARMVEHMNAQLCEDLPLGRFITAFVGYLDPSKHTITYSAPGQAPLLVIRADGSYEERSANGMPMGIDPETPPERVAPFELGVGDVFALLSDGYIEAQAPDNEQFGLERTLAAVRRGMSRSAEDILSCIDMDVREFVRGRPFGDDQTAVIIKRER